MSDLRRKSRGGFSTRALLGIALLAFMIVPLVSPVLEANAATYYKLTIQSPTGSGSTSPPTGYKYYRRGTNVEVTATPSTGYKFDHWIKDGDDAGESNPIFVSMYSSHTLKAVFIASTPSNSLTITAPNSGQSWVRGTSNTITWEKSGSTGSYVKIELLKGTSVNTVLTSSTSNDGSYSWNIPSTQTTGSDYKIRITSTSNTGISDTSDNFAITTTTTTTPPPSSGDMVVSSELINFYSMSSSEVDTFLNLIKQQGFTEITVRMNAMNEWSSGVPNSSGVSKAKEVITKATQRGITVNIDLHTWYTTWDNSFDDSASNAASNRQKYLTYIGNTIDAFSGQPVKAWMVLNEPQAQTASSGENQFILNCLSTAKQHTSKPVSIRFMAGYSPSTGHYSTAIDDASGFLCRNTYWDPRKPTTSVYGSTEAKLLAAIKAAHDRGKEIWITEFGKTNSNQSEQASYIRSFIDWAESKNIDHVYAWVIQPESPTGETYNIFTSTYQPLPAFYELEC